MPLETPILIINFLNFASLIKLIQSDLKQIFTYQPLLKNIIYLLLISQFWAITASYCYWMVSFESELVDLGNSEENESEEEENKKEKDDKFRGNLYTLKFDVLASIITIFHSEKSLALYHPEITTPPPESFLILS